VYNLLFVTGFALSLALLLRWAFKALPSESWQVIASMPVAKNGHDSWRGLNLTYYGMFVATAVTAAGALILMLMASVGVSVQITAVVLLIVLPVWAPAAKVVARIVENKPHTFTIGGATFVGMFMTPLAVWLTNALMGPRFGTYIPLLPALAAMAVAYTIGEGIGRLACISFGCCYGKPISQCSGLVRQLFGRHAFVFSGKTKKIAYEGGLDGKEVVPIQALTSVIHAGVGLVALFLFLNRGFFWALVLSMGVTQAWRAFSETLRIDYRGEGSISAYQIMAIIAVALTVIVGSFLSSDPARTPDLVIGLSALWHPAVILGLQAVWVGTFLVTGRSMVTGSILSFHVFEDRT
jgi:hypothetical protein